MSGLWFNYSASQFPSFTWEVGPVGMYSVKAYVEPYAVPDQFFVYASVPDSNGYHVLAVHDQELPGAVRASDWLGGLAFRLTSWVVKRTSVDNLDMYTTDQRCWQLSEESCYYGLPSRGLCEICYAPLKLNFRSMLHSVTPRIAVDREGMRVFRERWRIGHHEPHPICTERVKEHSPWTLIRLYRLVKDLGVQMPRIGFVDIGAAEGVDDPVMPFAESLNLTGIGVEADGSRFAHLAATSPRRAGATRLVDTFLTPDNVASVLRDAAASLPRATRSRAAGGPPLGCAVGTACARDTRPEVFVLKVDIDSYDCLLAEEALEAVNAMVVRVEVNNLVPPPYKFVRQYTRAVDFQPLYTHDRFMPSSGCSTSYLVERMLRRGYFLLVIDMSDLVFLRDDLARRLESHSQQHWTVPVAFPQDEIACWQQSFVLVQGVAMRRVREWYFAADVHGVLPLIRGNLSRLGTMQGFADVPFALYL